MSLEQHQEDLRTRGFTIATEDDLGVPGLRHSIADAFFNERALPPVPDTDGPVKTRYRSKDFMHYRWDAGALRLRETSHGRYARIGTGEHCRRIPRFRWCDVPGAEHVARMLIAMVPPEERHASGTLGLHGFRSLDEVVSGAHHDGFELGGTYVIERTCGGAVSYLYDMRQGERQVLDHQLQPGEILLFRERYRGGDHLFLHGATPLEGAGYRDALVIQLEAPEDLDAARDEAAQTGSVW